jgi:hypothetical protein
MPTTHPPPSPPQMAAPEPADRPHAAKQAPTTALAQLALQDPLVWLHGWYTAHCDGVWEHTGGLSLDPVPARGRRRAGLRLTVELPVPQSPTTFRSLSLHSVDGAWLTCTLTPERFSGSANHERLEELISLFRAWIEPE